MYRDQISHTLLAVNSVGETDPSFLSPCQNICPSDIIWNQSAAFSRDNELLGEGQADSLFTAHCWNWFGLGREEERWARDAGTMK